jgi:hypothetical protein
MISRIGGPYLLAGKVKQAADAVGHEMAKLNCRAHSKARRSLRLLGWSDGSRDLMLSWVPHR